jgi:hypothetical protein
VFPTFVKPAPRARDTLDDPPLATTTTHEDELTGTLTGFGPLVRNQVLEAGRGAQARPAADRARGVLAAVVHLDFSASQMLASSLTDHHWGSKKCRNEGAGWEAVMSKGCDAMKIECRAEEKQRHEAKRTVLPQTERVLAGR